jgi:hypothetical protein
MGKMQHIRALQTNCSSQTRGSVYGRVQCTQHEGATVWTLPAGVGAAGSLWMKARHLWARH